MGGLVWIEMASIRPFLTSRDNHPLIDLRFSGTCHRFLSDDHGDGERETMRLKEIRISFKHLYGACGAILEELEHWPHLAARQRKEMAVFTLRETRKAIKLMPETHNVLRIHFVASLDYIGITRPEVGRVSYRRDEEEVCMVAAAESSVEKLMERKKKKIWSGGEECAICMEGYSGDCEVVSMPCSHDFHGDCIYMWLRKSHNCPLCRFEMPITT